MSASYTCPSVPNTSGRNVMYASGAFSWGALRKLSTLRIDDCMTAVPIAPVEAPMMPVGLRANELCPQGREPQSMAFFNAPGMERLHSGDTSSSPSAPSIALLNAVTAAIGSSSSSRL